MTSGGGSRRDASRADVLLDPSLILLGVVKSHSWSAMHVL